VVTRHPLPARLRHWNSDALELYEERCGLVQDGCKVSREESERLGEEIVRSGWVRATDALPGRGCAGSTG
jgi:hypothetical protein